MTLSGYEAHKGRTRFQKNKNRIDSMFKCVSVSDKKVEALLHGFASPVFTLHLEDCIDSIGVGPPMI